MSRVENVSFREQANMFDFAKPTQVFKFCFSTLQSGFFSPLCCPILASTSKKVMSEFVNIIGRWKQHIGSREKADFLGSKLLQSFENLQSGMKVHCA